MKRNYNFLLSDIVEAVNRIKKYTNNTSKDEFINDDKTIDAVLRNLEIIGEASSRLPEEIRNKYEVPWREIKDFRNIVAHKYWSVDLDIVWDIIQNELEVLKQLSR